MPPNVFHLDKVGEPLDVESLRFPAHPESVSRARHLVTGCLRDWGLGDLVSPCAQTVTELATNSVTETGVEKAAVPETFSVHLCRTATHLVLKVSDASSEPPKPRIATEYDENGRGLTLVEGMADHWGWYPVGTGGKIVYAVWSVSARSVKGAG